MTRSNLNKSKWLAAAASFAFVASGVAYAQDNPNQRHDQQPQAQHNEMRAPAAQTHGEATPRAAEMQRRDEPSNKPADAQRMQPPKAADNDKRMETRPEPKAAENPRMKGETDKTRGAQAEPAQRERRDTANDNRPNNANDANRTAAQHNGADERNGARTAQHDEGRGPVRVMGRVKMSDEHATRVSEVLRRGARPERVNVAIRIGERIPEGVELLPLPAEVLAIAPDYRGYDYFVDSDDEIVFVAPDTHEIVGSIDYEGRAASMDETNVSAARPCPTEN